jgi:fucose permease
MNIKNDFRHTLCASYIGFISQAIVNNFAPLLFLTFQKNYNISLEQITILVTVNFGFQTIIALAAAKYVDKIGYRVSAVLAHIFTAVGLIGFAVFPSIFSNFYTGLLLSISIYAIGGGLIDVLVSPIVEACPTRHKSAAMSLLHSFYCWGQVFVIIISTLFFAVLGIDNWRFLAIIWAIIPLLNAFYFLRVPILKLAENCDKMPNSELLSSKLFWLFVILMICSGASGQAMNQWASDFAESGLHVSKTIGDLTGPCLFAVFMGTSRVLYSKLNTKIHLFKYMIGSTSLCILSYILATISVSPLVALIGFGLCGLSVGILWPGTFSLSSARFPKAGTSLFAFLAFAGNLGCLLGPTVVGAVSAVLGNNLKIGLLFAVLFPILMLLCLLVYISFNHTSIKPASQCSVRKS